MEGPIDPWLVWSRAMVLGALATGLGTVGHVSADGLLPGVATLAILAVLMVSLSALLLLGPASSARLALSLASGQAVVHGFLTATAGHGDHGMDHHGPSMQMTGEAVHGSSLSLGPILAHVTEHGPMMAVHLAAAALVGLWLARGESALWALIALAARRLVLALVAPVLAVVDPRPHRLVTPTPRPVGPQSPWQAQPRSRRAPPLALAN